MLGALARALRLHDAERAHLYHLAGEVPAPPTGPSPEVPAGILHLLDRLDDTPAYVVDAKYEILAWNPMAAAWFPEGKEDPSISLIKVHPHSAEYWESTNSKVVQLLGVARALLTGKRYDTGVEHGKVNC